MTTFTVNYSYVPGEESEGRMQAFFERFSRFQAGSPKLLERVYGDGFLEQDCWIFDESSLEAILEETGGDLFAYDVLNLPEDWLFYVGDSILLQVISHEQEATLRISDAQYERFKELGLAHGSGCGEFTGLPEQPDRAIRR